MVNHTNSFLFSSVETPLTQLHTNDNTRPPQKSEIENLVQATEDSDIEEYSEGDDDVPLDMEYEDENRPMTYEEMEAMYKPKTVTTQAKVAFEDDVIESSPSEGDSNEYSEENEYDDDDDISEVDDSDLLKRLEEKYGKLPATSVPADEDIEDDDVDDGDEDDIDPTWTSKFTTIE